MRKFPGVIERYGGSNGTKYHLNEEQIEWIRRWYPVTENKRLAKAMGVYIDRVRIFAREYGIVKSKEGMKAINKRRVKVATKTNYKNGCYERKCGKPVSEATKEGQRKRWQKIREGKLYSPIKQLRHTDPQRYADLMERKSKSRKEMVYKEKRRIIYGLERKTNLKVVVMRPYTQSQTHHRCSALKRGYMLDFDCSEGQPGRYIIYYDSETKRSEKFESNCIRDGFTIKPDV